LENYADLNNFKQMDKDYDEYDQLDEMAINRRGESLRDFQTSGFSKKKGKWYADLDYVGGEMTKLKSAFRSKLSTTLRNYTDSDFKAKKSSIIGYGLNRGNPRDEDA
jgi:hypothetical protein